MRFRPITGIAVLSFLIVLTFGIYAVKAQESGGTGFRLSPASYEIDTDPGKTVTRPVEVTNLTNSTQKAIPVVNDFIAPDDESGTPRLLVDSDGAENPRSIQAFILPMSEFTLEPGQSKTVDVTLSLPEETSPGAYYGVVRFVAESENTPDDANITLTASVGTVFLVNVQGDTVSLLNLEEMGAIGEENGDVGSFFSSSPPLMVVRLANDGNTFEAPFGKILVKDWGGNVVYEYEINDKEPRGNVLPDSVRRFEHELQNIGSFGRYTIEGFISYGDGGSIIDARASFWVIPWVPILVGTFAIAGLAFLGTRGLKAYNARVINKSKKGY